MRLISDGVVDREGVDGLAARVGYTPRHLGRLLTAELGAGPLALARARRAQTARVLIETTDLQFAEIAFAAGFASIRQFNDTIREVYDLSPTELRGRRGGQPSTGDGDDAAGRPDAVRRPRPARVPRRCGRCRASRRPATAGTRGRWGSRTAPARSASRSTTTRSPGDGVRHGDLRPRRPARHRRRRRARTPPARRRLRPGRRRRGARPPTRCSARWSRPPGLRVPGHVDGDEVAVRAVLGQQVTVAARAHHRRPAGRASSASRWLDPDGGLTHLFPDAATPGRRSTPRTCRCRGRAAGPSWRCAGRWPTATSCLDRGAGRDETRAGPARAARHRAVDRRLHRPARPRRPRRVPADRPRHPRRPRRLGAIPAPPPNWPRRWRPWRSYAQMHLWRHVIETTARGEVTCTP